MKKTFAALAICALALTPTLLTSTQPAHADDPMTRGDVETIIQEYLLENPEIIRDAIEELERREIAAANRARSEAVSTVSDVLFNSVRQVELGNPNGNVTLVEFFDYNCGYCRRAAGDKLKLIESDPNLRVVLKEFPVLGQASIEAAQVAVAINRVAPEKYLDFHMAMVSSNGRANMESALEVAVGIGLDRAEVEAAIGDPEVYATLEEAHLIGRRIQVNATPAYVVGDEVMLGAVGYERLKAEVEATRNCAEATC